MKYFSHPSWPGSLAEPFEITSPENGRYNCIAWVLGDTVNFIWPGRKGFFDWPEDLPRRATVKNFIQFFKKHGFEICENGSVEPGFQKIVLFAKKGKPEHAARQLPDEKWTSKLGIHEDVRHSLASISVGIYGEVCLFLKRPIFEKQIKNLDEKEMRWLELSEKS